MKPRPSRRAPAEKKGAPKLSEVIPELIRLYEDRSDYREEELPKLYKDYPLLSPGEEDETPESPQDVEMRQLLAKLPEDAIYQIILIEYLGRGYFGTSDLAEPFEAIKDEFGDPEAARSYIRRIGSLAWHLTDGLAKLEESWIDVDKLDQLLRKPPRARK